MGNKGRVVQDGSARRGRTPGLDGPAWPRSGRFKDVSKVLIGDYAVSVSLGVWAGEGSLSGVGGR
jgi:hypothetical protein